MKPADALVVLIGMAFAGVALAALLASIAWPLWGIVRWQGPWRAAAALPLAVVTLLRHVRLRHHKRRRPLS